MIFKKNSTIIGFLFLITIGGLWILLGFKSIYFLLFFFSYIAFSWDDIDMKRPVQKLKSTNIKSIFVIGGAFILSVAIVFSLIQLGKYIVVDIWHVTGVLKVISQFIIIILALYPVKFTFWNIFYKYTS